MIVDWFALLVGAIEKIPATFWGVVAGSFLTLSGILLTNRANDLRLLRQLSNDRNIRISDRELSLRKEVYLAASEALAAGLICLGKFANLDAPHDKISEEYLSKAPVLAKVQLIATEPTLREISNVLSELSASHILLSGKRVPLAIRKQQLIQLDTQIANFAKDRDSMLELMKQHNLEGSNDQRRWATIQANFAFAESRVAETLQQKSRPEANLYQDQLKYMEECVNISIEIRRLLAPAVILLRDELMLPIDGAGYLRNSRRFFTKRKGKHN